MKEKIQILIMIRRRQNVVDTTNPANKLNTVPVQEVVRNQHLFHHPRLKP